MASKFRAFLKLITAASALMLIVWLVDIWRSGHFDVNPALVLRGIPSLPGSATIVNRGQGGFFSRWLFVVVSMRQDELIAYEALLLRESHRFFRLGENSPQARVVTRDVSSDDLDNILQDGLEIVHKMTPPGVSDREWDVEAIRHGTVYQRVLPDACRYTIYVDRDRNRLFLLWTRS